VGSRHRSNRNSARPLRAGWTSLISCAGYVATAPEGGTELRNARLPNPPTVERAADAVSFVAARKAEGSDYLKIVINGVRTADQGMPTLDEARVRALVDAAHQQGMLTIAHIETVGDTEIALASGVDSLAHVWRRGGANLDLARRIAARRVPVTLTLAIPDGRLPASRESLLADGRLRPFMSPRIVQQLSQTANPPAQANLDPRRILDLHIEAARSLHTAGARLMVGTDAAMANDSVQHSNPTVHGISVHRELELLVTDIELSQLQALAAATTNPAEGFRLTDRGRIEVGRKADLVLVRGNPMVNITATRDVLRVWRSGVELTRTVPGQ
jgi:imidazolonepropionase-like amidohydrolase